MPPKKNKPNGFQMFMLEMKPKLEREGHKFPRGLLDVQPFCSPLWANMTAEQKAVYTQRAKGCPAVKQEKLDSRGVPIAWKEREEQQKASAKMQIFQKIEDMVSYLAAQNELENHNFHLAHFNYAVATDEGEYPPCEIAIVKFSLLNGIDSHYHEFVDPGKIRTGYGFPAKEHSDKTHRIPATGFKLYNSDYQKITNSITDMLKQPDGGIAPLFFLDEEMKSATYILEFLIEKSYQGDASNRRATPFQTYSLNKLFYELRRHADLNDPRLKFTSTSQVAEKLCNGTFDFYQNMACQWHEDEDNVQFCALTRVRNFAYTISDLCCEYYGFRLLPNRHCPAAFADEDRYEVLPKIAKRDPEVSPPVEEQEEQAEAVPRLPRTFSRVIEETVGPRVAANFNGLVAGQGRGILGGAQPEKIESPPPAGRGRGRGLLLSFD